MSDRRDENFPSPFDGIELPGGGGGTSKKSDKDQREDVPEAGEKTPTLSRKQIRAIKNEVTRAEASLTGYLAEVTQKELSPEGVEEVLVRLGKYCEGAQKDLEPIKEDELALKWDDRRKKLEDHAAGIRAAIAAGELGQALEILAPLIAFFSGLAPLEDQTKPALAEGVPTPTPPDTHTVVANAETPTAEAPPQQGGASTKEDIFRLIEEAKGLTLFEKVNEETEKKTKLGVGPAKQMAEQIFAEFEDPRFKQRNPSVEKRRRIIDRRLKDLGVKKGFGEDVMAVLSNLGVFAEMPAPSETDASTRAERLPTGVEFNFNTAKTLEEVYQMLEKDGEELIAMPAPQGSVRKNNMVQAKVVAGILRAEVPKILSELSGLPVDEQRTTLDRFSKMISGRGYLNDAMGRLLRNALREAGASPEVESKDALDFDEAGTLTDVYTMLEKMGDAYFTVRSRKEGVPAARLISAKTVLATLRKDIPKMLNELRRAEIADRQEKLDEFFKTIPAQYNLRSAVKVFIRGYLRDEKIVLKEATQEPGEVVPPEAAQPGVAPEVVRPTRTRREKLRTLHELGWPDSAIRKLGEDGVKSALTTQQRYPASAVKTPASVPGAPTVTGTPTASVPPTLTTPLVPPTPTFAPANLGKLMPKTPEASAAATAAAAVTGSETLVGILDDNPEFRAFFAKVANAEQLLEDQNTLEIEKYRKAFAIKDKLATDLYELANGAIKGDFLLDFDNPDSNLPKNGKEARKTFQEYVDAEALERPEQLLNLATQLETRGVLEKNIATAKAEVDRLGGKDFFNQAEQDALDLKKHLERVHESTRRDSVSGWIPNFVESRMLKTMYWMSEKAGWKEQTEATIAADFSVKRDGVLKGRTVDALDVWEKLALDKVNMAEKAKLAGLKRHQALGERMVEASQQGVSRAALEGSKINLGLGSLLTYNPFWKHHPEVAQKLLDVEATLAEIRQKKQTIEQAEQSFAQVTQQFESLRTATYTELPPTIALVRYAQAQIKNTLTSFTADTAVEDLQRIYEYMLLLDGNRGTETGADPFQEIANIAEMADKLHEAIVAQWGNRVFAVFEKTAINKKGAIADMEKMIQNILKQEAIGGMGAESQKAKIMKGLLAEAFKKIDPTKGDGRERRMALMGVMINCDLLKKGEKITT
ncbi:MAG: hypothetical protein AAB391_02480 [Patescibacteria group bacterium]|mgnify:CR=1 FL=1